MSEVLRRVYGAGAAVFWILLCVRWFDAGIPVRPAWLAALSPAAVAIPGLACLLLWLGSRWSVVSGPTLGPARGALLLGVGLALLFRLPPAWQAPLGYTTSDGALSGIVALHLREGIDRLVFVPSVPYSGSLKSHLTALLSLAIDPGRAFALASVLFYGLFVAALVRLALLASPRSGSPSGEWVALASALYAAFAPAFVTRYSLSNDGNYVEVLALGTLALGFAARWPSEPQHRATLALLLGLSLGLAFWCHILALIYLVAVAVFLLFAGRRPALRAAGPLVAGFGLGYLPGLLWNAQNGWESFRYVLPGGQPVAGLDPSLGMGERLAALLLDQGPVLLGYDLGYPPALDGLFLGLAFLAMAALTAAILGGVRAAVAEPWGALGALLVLFGVNVGVALWALPLLPGNPRYLLFLMTPIPVLLARSLSAGRRRWLLALLIALGALGSLAQWPSAQRAEGRWREFVRELEHEGVRFCYTDFYLATKISFVSEERIVCSAKLGPTTTEYFHDYRRRVESADQAALIAVNTANAAKLERRLRRLGVGYERKDWMKPVLLRLTRKVDPEELFPERSFPPR